MVEWKDRQTNYHVGVIIAVRASINGTEISLQTGTELVSASFDCPDKFLFVVGVFHRPPNSYQAFMDKLCCSIEEVIAYDTKASMWMAEDIALQDHSHLPIMDVDPFPTMKNFPITEEGVQKLLSNFDPCKATSPNSIPSKFLKDYAEEISPALTLIFKASLQRDESHKTIEEHTSSKVRITRQLSTAPQELRTRQ